MDEGLEDVGQSAVKLSDFYGQVAADNAVNNYIQQSTSILRGDPGGGIATGPDGQPVTGPGGQPVHKGGYFSLRGADAMSAFQDTSENLDEALRETRESLQTPAAQRQFDNEARRYRAQYANEMGEHYDQQFQQWAVNTNTTGIALTQNQIATHLNDPDALAQDQQTLRQYFVKRDQAQLGSSDPQVQQGAVLKADQTFYTTQIKVALGTDPSRAQDILDKSGTTLASLPEYDGIVRQVKEAVFQQKMSPAVDTFVANALGTAQHSVGAAAAGTPAAQDVSAAIGRQEWNGKGPAPTSIDGAVGPSQIKPDTARQYDLDPARLNEPAYAKYARDTIISKIAEMPQVQGDPARIAVGYFSGPGNIAPQGSPTPYVRDVADGNGKTVSSYVADVTGRLQKYPTTADALTASHADLLDQARQQAEQLFPNYPDEQDRFITTVDRRLNQAEDQQRRQQEVSAHIVQSAMAGPNPPISEEQLMALSPQIADAWKTLQFTNPYVRAGIENRFNANSKGKALTFGTNFKDYFDRAMAPSSDPTRISNPTDLNNYVGPGDASPLTNTGSDQLVQLMAARNTPQGEAFAASSRAFVDQVHQELTFSNPTIGNVDPQGEQLFSKAMAYIAPKLLEANKNGTLNQILDPKNPDYLGNYATSLARTPSQMLADRLKEHSFNSPGISRITDLPTPQAQGLALLKEAVDMHRLTPQQAARISVEHGFFAKQPPAVHAGVPAPTIAAPPVTLQVPSAAPGG